MHTPYRNNMIFRPMFPERLKRINECKQKMLKAEPNSSFQCDHVDPRIVESWTRSFKIGLRPQDSPSKISVDEREISNALLLNRMIIKVAQNIFDDFSKYQFQNEGQPFYLELVDKNNIRLLGKGQETSFLCNYSKIPSESIIGTNCYNFVHAYHCPVQLYGPEHYLEILGNYLVSGAPIFDEDGYYLGGVFLTEKLKRNDNNTPILQNNSLHFICAVAHAIERNYINTRFKDKAKHQEDEKNFWQHLLDLTWNLSDHAIVLLDQDGLITQYNRQAEELLKPYCDDDPNLLHKRPFASFLKNPKNLLLALQKHQPGNFEGLLVTDHGEKLCTFNFMPLDNTVPQENVSGILQIERIQKSNKVSRKGSPVGLQTKFTFDDIIGESAAIKDAIETAKFLAKTDENILITGESGTGKELFAQAIHQAYSPDGPFIALNCAAFPRSLIESELFGYEPGTFTGAGKEGRPGKIELANGGTLFLDEIGDMPVDVQAILLRVLQDKCVVRLGGVNYKNVHFRVIAATNQNLKKLIDENKFRQDLYFRLSVLTLEIPPLRERDGDVELLAEYFLSKYCRKKNIPVPEISPEAKKLLLDNQWPGNVRELEDVMIHCVNMSRGKTICPKHVPEDVHKGTRGFRGTTRAHRPSLTTEQEKESVPTLKEMEAFYIEKALKVSNHNVSQAAAMLGISKTTLYRRIQELGINLER